MTEYIVKLGFWLRAYESLTVTAETDADAIKTAKVAAKGAMETGNQPEHIDTDERREGIIAFIDRITLDGKKETVIEDLEFDDDRIHPAPIA